MPPLKDISQPVADRIGLSSPMACRYRRLMLGRARESKLETEVNIETCRRRAYSGVLTAKTYTRPWPPKRKTLFVRLISWCLAAAFLAWSGAAVTLVSLRVVDPPFTAVQMERRVQAWIHRKPYRRRYTFVPLSGISPELQHAAIASEDARFYQHHGFDWHEIQIAAEEDLDGSRSRGASTITQQLVKNLFFGTGRSVLRKGAEFTLVPVAEFVLGKQRILELYLNVIEWGPGVFGADAASRYYYKTAARNVDRARAARLAAILPAPLKRRPDRMNDYSAKILGRMRQMGW